MKYERLDKKCHAKVLAVGDGDLLIQASWPAIPSDASRFHVLGTTAFNTVNVSKAYFEQKYGVRL